MFSGVQEMGARDARCPVGAPNGACESDTRCHVLATTVASRRLGSYPLACRACERTGCEYALRRSNMTAIIAGSIGHVA